MLKPLKSIHLFSLMLSSSLAAPAILNNSLLQRDNTSSFNGPVKVTTVTTTQTNVGTITQTCDITLTPITVNGQSAVREDKSCKETVSSNNNGGNNNGSGNNNNNNGASTSSTNAGVATSSSTSSSTSTASASTETGSVASPPNVSVIGTGTSSAQSSSSTGSNNAPPNVSVIGQSATGTGTGTAPSATSSSGSSVAAPNNVSVLGQSSVAASVASAAADQANTSAAAAQASSTNFVIPGKKLQVLPIGLGVFAGISVIALIVVGLVTYERTKYRKTFRQRKLAEAAAPMGYGGMAERN